MRPVNRPVRRILTTLQELVEQPPLRKPARSRASTTLPVLVARTHDRVRDLVEAAQARPAGAEQEELWHDARKAAKQSRYAAESVEPVFGEDAAAFATAMEAVQEALGEHQDSVLTRDRLRDLVLHAPPPRWPPSTVACTRRRKRAARSRTSTSPPPGRPRGASPSTAGCGRR